MTLAERITKAEAERADVPAWQMGPDQYQHRAGVHQPSICEISPFQYGQMSKRALDAYQKQRDAQWAASGAIKEEWAEQVRAAYQAGEITRQTPGLHKEAERVCLWADIHATQAEGRRRLEDALKRNRLATLDGVKIGDSLYSVMCSSYGEVVKVSAKSLRLRVPASWRPAGYSDVKENPGALQYESYGDVQARIVGEMTELQGYPFTFDKR